MAVRVIEELPRQAGRYQFTHALIQDTLAEELTPTRRLRLHGRIADALEALYGTDAEAHAAELAYHFVEAVTVTGPEKVVRYSLVAGERALSTYAYEEAQAHFERALQLKETQVMDGDTAALLFGLGRAQAATLEKYQLGDALASLRRAFDYYAEAGEITRAVAVAEYPFYPVVGRGLGVADLVGRALTLVPPDSHEAGRLLSRYGLALDLERRDYEGAREALGRALDIAQREEDTALEMRTLVAAADVDFYHLRLRESMENCLTAIDLARGVDDPRAEVVARLYAGRNLDYMGDLEGSRAHAAAMLPLAEKLRDRFWLSWAVYSNALVTRHEGDSRTSRDFYARGLAVAPREPVMICGLANLEYEAGNFSEADARTEWLLEVMRQTAPGPVHEYA